jgi:hypothetical protein
VDRLRGDEQDLAGVDRRRRLAVEVVLQRALQDVDDEAGIPLLRHKRSQSWALISALSLS